MSIHVLGFTGFVLGNTGTWRLLDFAELFSGLTGFIGGSTGFYLGFKEV